jgi:hypothetical protein
MAVGSFCDFFASDFAQAFWSTFLASALVAFLAYRLIEYRFQLQRERLARAELVRAVLKTVKAELEDNVTRAEALPEMVKREEVPYPLFDLNGWTLVSQATVFAALESATLNVLVRSYNRLRTADELYRHYNDLMYGATAVLAVTTIESLDEKTNAAHAEKFNAHRTTVGDRLVDRVEELLPLVKEAIERLEVVLKQGN